MSVERTALKPAFKSLDQVGKLLASAQTISEQDLDSARNFIADLLQKKKNVERITYLLYGLRLRRKAVRLDFEAECVAQSSDALVEFLQDEKNWEDVSFISAGLKLFKITLDAKLNEPFSKGWQALLQLAPLLVSNIDHLDTRLRTEISLLISKFISLRHSDSVERLLVQKFERLSDPSMYAYFIDCECTMVATTAHDKLGSLLQSEYGINPKSYEKLLRNWKNSDPDTAWYAYQKNIQALQALETGQQGVCMYLIEKCNVCCFAIFPRELLLEQVLKLQSPNIVAKDKQVISYALLTPLDDHSGKVYASFETWQLLYDKMKEIEEKDPSIQCNLFVTEFDNAIDLLHRVEDWSHRFGKFKGGIETSHGSPNGIILKKEKKGNAVVSTAGIKKLVSRLGLRGSYMNRLMACFEQNPQFVLDSCLTGRGVGSFAQTLSLSGADVYASDDEINSLYPNFNAKDDMKLVPLFIGGQNLLFKHGNSESYHAPDDELTNGFSEKELQQIDVLIQKRS